MNSTTCGMVKICALFKGTLFCNNDLNQNSAHVQCMSELCCNFQIPASNTLGGVAETRIVLQSVTDVRTYVRTNGHGKTICSSPLRDGGIIIVFLV